MCYQCICLASFLTFYVFNYDDDPTSLALYSHLGCLPTVCIVIDNYIYSYKFFRCPGIVEIKVLLLLLQSFHSFECGLVIHGITIET